MPAVSVLIPTYNRAEYLAQALASVRAQTFGDYEIIVVDDGSTDDTAAIAAQAGVTYLRQENQGVAAARNRAVAAAAGEWLAWLDSDDTWQPGFLATMMDVAARRPAAAIFYARAQCMDSDGRPLPQVAGAQLVAPAQMYETLLRANFLIPSTMLTRRAAIVAAGAFDPALVSAEDWDLWLRLAAAGVQFIGSPTCLTHYRLHPAALSTRVAQFHQAALAVAARHFGPEDGDPAGWPGHKRLMYGGVYRGAAVNALIHDGDWDAVGRYLSRALDVDPALATADELFYELALGAQPAGWRGTSANLALAANAAGIAAIMQTWATRRPAPAWLAAASFSAEHALARVGYNTGNYRLSRRHLRRAWRQQPARFTAVAPLYFKAWLRGLQETTQA